MDIVDLSKHSTMKYVGNMQTICKPLEKHLQIDYFNHIRIFPDNSRICLTNKGAWVDYFCREKLYLIDPLATSPIKQSHGELFWDERIDDKIYQTASKYFNICHRLTLTERRDGYIDYFHFGVQTRYLKNAEYYSSIKDLLESFILIYQQKATKLITSSQKIILPELMPKSGLLNNDNKLSSPPLSQNISVEQKQNFINALKTQRYYLDPPWQNTYLTAREIDCLRWLIKGKSAEEISLVLDISKLTAITHIRNIKDKLNCNKITEVIYKLASTRLKHVLGWE